ncbi:uncharacterized protein CXorf49 homolog [Diceros bicornis minor]|uniref:uncharacterized protein CXorf49 homolog n=1 Tax=Diceros bicornis minor TaxID=77932 RepID=UPI0026EB11B5|nr:uncharacterized protein CXorf49 homolog [Diceros bicornis minor]
MRPGAAQTHDMSSPDEVSVSGAGFSPEGGERAGVRPAEPRAPQAPGLGRDLGAPRRAEGEGEGGFPDPEGLESEQQVMEAGGPVLWGRQGRRSSLADDEGDAVDSASRLAHQSAVNVVQQLAEWAVRSIWRNPSPESGAGLEAGASGRGAPALSCVQSQPAPAAPLHLGGPEGGRAWGNPKRGSRSRMMGTAGRLRPSAEGPLGLPSDSKSSDEFSETQLMRLTLYPKEGGQAKPNSPEDPGDTPRHCSFHARENFPHVPGPFPSSNARAFTLAVQRQAVGELDFSSSKKMQSVVWGKVGSRPSYPEAGAAGGGLAWATPPRKATQEKESLGDASQVAQGRIFPAWGQRVSAARLDPATFPPISGVPLLGRSKKYSLARAGTKQSKHTGTGKKSVARRTRESELVVAAGEDNDPNRDPAPQGQLPAHRPGPCCPCKHRGEGSRGDLNNGACQVRGESQPLALSQGDVMPRGPAASGDQEPLHHPPRPKRQQQPPGAQGCRRCLVLQREVDDLKEQLAAMQSLADKFQSLSS